jgi:hypothetical protein
MYEICDNSPKDYSWMIVILYAIIFIFGVLIVNKLKKTH